MEEKQMTEKERMNKGLYYNSCDKEILQDRYSTNEKCVEYNNTKPSEEEKRQNIIKSIIKTKGNFFISKNFYVDYGYNVTLGNNFYSCFNLTILDENEVYFGDNIFIGPNCSIYTAAHPIDDYQARNASVEYAKPIKLGNNIFIGANVSILPGVNIGNNVIIGAGSIITKNIPDNCIAYGIPCKKKKDISFNLENIIIQLINRMKCENVNLNYKFNISDIDKENERKEIIKKYFKKTGENFRIKQKNLFLNGSNISIGENFYTNYNSIIMDTAEISIGDNFIAGPNLTIVNTTFKKEENNEYKLKDLPIKIGNNVWIGGNVTIIGGISIGNNCVIGAGSIISKDIPDNCIVVGNHCKILRKFELNKLELNNNDKRSEKEKMLSEDWYLSSDNELSNDRKKIWNVCHKFNYCINLEEREKMLRSIFKKVEKSFFVTPYFNCDYGYNISIGENFYSNFNLVLLDVAEIKIGENCFIGPNTSLYTAFHPIEDPQSRNKGIEKAKNITIGNNVWLGGNVVILAGVSIGNNCVIGCGSVVTKNIPDNCVACGNPCKVFRQIDPSKKVDYQC